MYVPLIDLFYKLSQEVFKLVLLFLVLTANILMPTLVIYFEGVEKSAFNIMQAACF